MAALLGLAVHAYCLRPRALPWPFFRLAGPGEPLFEARVGSCYSCQLSNIWYRSIQTSTCRTGKPFSRAVSYTRFAKSSSSINSTLWFNLFVDRYRTALTGSSSTISSSLRARAAMVRASFDSNSPKENTWQPCSRAVTCWRGSVLNSSTIFLADMRSRADPPVMENCKDSAILLPAMYVSSQPG